MRGEAGIFHALTPFVLHCPEDLVDLSVVDDSRDIAPLFVHTLDESPEDRPDVEHGAMTPMRSRARPDVLRDPVRQGLTVLRGELRADLGAADVLRSRVDPGSCPRLRRAPTIARRRGCVRTRSRGTRTVTMTFS